MSIAGVGTSLRVQWRTGWKVVLAWVLGLTAIVLLTTTSITGLYDTPDKLRSYAETTAGPGMRVLNGAVAGTDTLGGVLVNELGYGWDEVHDEAEVLEHAISDRLLEGIAERLGHPTHDPHGDAIPDASGAVVREPFLLLAEAPLGHAGRVLRVSDRDPALLRALEGAGIDVGHSVRVTGRGAVQVDDGASIELSDAAASAVWLTA